MKSGSRVRVRSWKRSKSSFVRASLYCCSLSSTSSGSLMDPDYGGPVVVGGTVQESRPPLPSPVRRAPREERSRRTARSMVPVGGPEPNRPRGLNRPDHNRHGVYIVRRVTQIEAHITGTVWKIEVAVGDTVAEGDSVVILESMKME